MLGFGADLFRIHNFAFGAYCVLFFALTSPFWLLGEVTAPHRQNIETGIVDTQSKVRPKENRKFSDYTNYYIPDIYQYLKGPRSGWLTLWTNQNELGRPFYQISGFSPAYLPSWVIAQLTDNPWKFITALSLLFCFGTGIFIILFCRETGLSPLAGLIAGSTLATSPFFMYWLTFPMFLAVWCWATGSLWAVARLDRKPDLLGWSVLAFSAYSLLMTAYPQLVVYQAYILAGYGLYLAYRKHKLGILEVGRFLALSASAAIVGVALALPVYLDLANLYAESSRVAPDPSYFAVVLPTISTLTDAMRFFVLSTGPELFGNPIEATYPFPYNGLSLTPMVIFFSAVSLLVSSKKTWGWWLVIVALFGLAFFNPFYLLAIKYLGFNISRSTPLASLLLPLSIIVAYGVDALVKRSIPGELSRVVWIAAATVLATIALGLGFGLSQGVTIRWGIVLEMSILIIFLVAQYEYTRPALLIAALVTVLATISYPLMLRQDLSQIATTSPLVEKVRANLAPGSSFACVAPGLAVLPPNLNAELGLASVHSYNSLSSRRYHTLVKVLGGEMQTYGRYNGAISPDYDSTMFWMSNISLMLSPTKLAHKNLEDLGEVSGVYLYKVISRMGDNLQFGRSGTTISTEGLQVADPRLLPRYASSKLFDRGDLMEYKVTPGTQSVLVLCQNFHRDWQAQVLDHSGWAPAKTTVLNGVFQCVLLPQDTQRVRLAFKPYARYAWIAHGFWLFLMALLGFKAWQKYRHSGEQSRFHPRN